VTRRAAVALALAAMAAIGAAGRPAASEPLYEAQAIVTGQGEANRLQGFAHCLEDVLVKVSGDPGLMGDRRLAALSANAAQLVAGFDYHDRMSGIPVHDEQGTRDRPYDLTVRFDAAKIDAALRSLGIEPWTAARPRVVVFLAVRNGPTSLLVAADGDRGRDQRDSLIAAAYRRGVPVVLPTAQALAGAGLTFDRLSAVAPARLNETARKLGGDLALAGRLTWIDPSREWSAEWRLAHEGSAHQWHRRSATFDEAFRDALAGVAQILSGHGQPDRE